MTFDELKSIPIPDAPELTRDQVRATRMVPVGHLKQAISEYLSRLPDDYLLDGDTKIWCVMSLGLWHYCLYPEWNPDVKYNEPS